MGEQEGQTIGAILHTADGGATWQEQLSTPCVEYFGVKAVRRPQRLGDGNAGYLRTRDGGQQWENSRCRRACLPI